MFYLSQNNISFLNSKILDELYHKSKNLSNFNCELFDNNAAEKEKTMQIRGFLRIRG